jgi:Flp pilus assembly protein TadG
MMLMRLNPGRVLGSPERGAVSSIVAILFAGGVVFGLGALTVDVGSMMWERRQVQNGADAAATTLASACANAESNCRSNLPAIQQLDDSNASDGHSSADGVCGRFPSTYTPVGIATLCASATSDASIGDLAKCPALPSWLKSGAGASLPYVEVYTGTSTNGSSSPTLLPGAFSQAITGSDNPHISACARATWGPPGGNKATVPITISTCEWQTYTSGGSTYVVDPPSGPSPGYGGPGQPAFPPAATWPNTAGHELVVMLHDTSVPTCSYNGKDTAGGFGYLDPAASTCTTNIQTVNGSDYWARIDTGSSASPSCQAALASRWKTVIDLPVFDCLVKSTSGVPSGGIAGLTCTGASPGSGGAQTYYHIAGWAKFYLSGYKIGGGASTERASVVSGIVPCSNAPGSPGGSAGGSGRCLTGWFVQGTLDSPGVDHTGTGSDFGAYGVEMAG